MSFFMFLLDLYFPLPLKLNLKFSISFSKLMDSILNFTTSEVSGCSLVACTFFLTLPLHVSMKSSELLAPYDIHLTNWQMAQGNWLQNVSFFQCFLLLYKILFSTAFHEKFLFAFWFYYCFISNCCIIGRTRFSFSLWC